MTFELSEEQEKKLYAWLKDEVYPKAIKKQKRETRQPSEFDMWSWEQGIPYTGTIGGNLTYEFTPTSVGLAVRVKEGITGEVIDLTEYDLW